MLTMVLGGECSKAALKGLMSQDSTDNTLHGCITRGARPAFVGLARCSTALDFCPVRKRYGFMVWGCILAFLEAERRCRWL